MYVSYWIDIKKTIDGWSNDHCIPIWYFDYIHVGFISPSIPNVAIPLKKSEHLFYHQRTQEWAYIVDIECDVAGQMIVYIKTCFVRYITMLYQIQITMIYHTYTVNKNHHLVGGLVAIFLFSH